MPFISLPDGTVCHIRMARRRRRRCTQCGQAFPEESLRECDFPMERGTCDKIICTGCARRVGPELDLCPEHANTPTLFPLGDSA
jgi:hypothetical protein